MATWSAANETGCTSRRRIEGGRGLQLVRERVNRSVHRVRGLFSGVVRAARPSGMALPLLRSHCRAGRRCDGARRPEYLRERRRLVPAGWQRRGLPGRDERGRGRCQGQAGPAILGRPRPAAGRRGQLRTLPRGDWRFVRRPGSRECFGGGRVEHPAIGRRNKWIGEPAALVGGRPP